MAREDPELAAKLVIQTLPAAAAKVPGKLTYGLVVDGLGEYTVVIDSGRAAVTEGLNGAHRLQPLDERHRTRRARGGHQPAAADRVRPGPDPRQPPPRAEAARDVERRDRPGRRDRERRRRRPRPALPLAAVPDRPRVDARARLPAALRDRRPAVGHRDSRRRADSRDDARRRARRPTRS